MKERLEETDDFEIALGVAALAPPEVYRELQEGIRRGETAEQINRRLDRYREKPKYDL